MKKMAALFTESMREFRNIRTITACGLFAALALILHRSMDSGSDLKLPAGGTDLRIFPVPQTDKLLADSGGGADSGAFGERPARNLLAVSGVR